MYLLLLPDREACPVVHGRLAGGTQKRAAAKGCQVLSFDLPEHGERKEEATRCKVQECVRELDGVMD